MPFFSCFSRIFLSPKAMSDGDDDERGDCFSPIFDNASLFSGCIWCYLSIQIVGNGLLFILIESVKRVQMKGLLHKCLSKTCYLQVVYNLIPLNLNLARFVFGPMPGYLCTLRNLTKYGLIWSSLIVHHQSFLIWFAFWGISRRLPTSTDPFLNQFLDTFNLMICSLILGIAYFLNEDKGMHFQVCTGSSRLEIGPDEDCQSHPGITSRSVLWYFGVYHLFFAMFTTGYIIGIKRVPTSNLTYYLKPTLFLSFCLVLSYLPESLMMLHVDPFPELNQGSWPFILTLSYFLPSMVYSILMPTVYIYYSDKLRHGISMALRSRIDGLCGKLLNHRVNPLPDCVGWTWLDRWFWNGYTLSFLLAHICVTFLKSW